MAHFDVFNGDADGLCALHQLRLEHPMDSTLITGVKRDIDLVKRVEANPGDSVTVLDVSFDKNRDALTPLLGQGVDVLYIDHHFAGDIPDSDHLETHIDTASETCTGLIVNRYLKGACLPWAVTAAFGDNLFTSARTAAEPLNLSEEQLSQLEMLGTLLNYNGYGSALSDLYFAPDDLYRKISPYRDPFAFIEEDEAYSTLAQGYEDDMSRAAATKAAATTDTSALYIYPYESFARRVSGVYSNQLARDNPDRAHALLSTLEDGAYLVSVRAPLSNREGADDLCRQFPTGGGRKAAAGINHLPADQLDNFTAAFQAQFAG